MVSYQDEAMDLPSLLPGLLTPAHRSKLDLSAEPQVLDAYYARTYTWQFDLEIVWKSWRYIGT